MGNVLVSNANDVTLLLLLYNFTFTYKNIAPTMY